MAFYEEVHDDDDYDDYDDYDNFHHSKSEQSNYNFTPPSKQRSMHRGSPRYYEHNKPYMYGHHGADYNAYCKSEHNTCHSCGQTVPTCTTVEKKRRETLSWKNAPSYHQKSDHWDEDGAEYPNHDLPNHSPRMSPRSFSKSDSGKRREEEILRRHSNKMRETSRMYGAFP